METRSKTAKARSENLKRTAIMDKAKSINTERDAAEDKISAISSSRHERSDGRQSERNSAAKSIRSSHANSNYRRKMIEAQVRADEQMAKVLSKQLEMEKQMIENRLALEKARLNEEYDLGVGDLHQFEDDTSCSVDSKVKVREWLQDIDESVKNVTGKRSFHNSHFDDTGSNKNNSLVPSSTHPVPDTDIRQLLARQSIEKDLPTFSGDTIEWPSFYQQFLSTTKLLGLSDEENMCRLRRALKGDARRSVEGVLLSTASVKSVIDILISRYGRADLIVKSLVNKAKHFPVMKNNDFRSLTHFAEDVSNLVVTLEIMDMRNYLECPQLLEEILQKLPYNMQLSWGEKVLNANGRSSLREFKEWIWRKSEAASYAQSMNVGKTSQSQTCGKIFPNQSNKERFKTTLVTSQEKRKTIQKCILCKEEHSIDKCKTFLDLSIDDKWNLIKSKGVCFSCLDTSHRIRFCRFKKKCGVNNCEKVHHKSLHNEAFDKSIENEDTTGLEVIAHTTKSYCSEILLKITPVIIRTSREELEVYALFDEASTVTLLDQELADKLCLPGKVTDLSLKWTQKDTCRKMTSRKVSFEISDKSKSTFYTMENVYTVENLDLPRQSVDGRRMKEKWGHLKQIDFASMYQAKPQLLIGQDHWELITTREVIEGPKNSPALSRTKLGWIAHGNLRQFRNRVDDNIVLHISHQKRCDEELHEEVKRYFSTEAFGVKIPEGKVMGSEDKRATEIIETVTRKIENEKRWKCGLLWKKDELVLPESKQRAIQRLEYIEKRMARDSEFSKAYRRKIQEYLDKNYAEKVDEEIEGPRRKWYLPHFGVVNINKPGKFRFVFDAAAKVDNMCLNDFLLRGPDLFNSLVGVIFKFREKDVAFSADIREMFHQITIRKEDRAAQRFLWRNAQNEEIATYEMKVMIFGSVCSPFSAQFVKNRNASEFQKEYPQAVDGIINRHYMDDYLDSVYTEEEAIRLVNEVIHIHRQGGFELRGWVCNSKKVYSNIPEELRGDEKLLEGSDNISQRILGLKWIPSTDHLKYSLQVDRMNEICIRKKKANEKGNTQDCYVSL